MRDVFGTVLRYKLWFDLWGARQRTLQAVLTIAIGAFAVGTILSALRGLQADTARTWSTVSAPSILLQITPPADDALIEALRNRSELTAVEGQMEQSITWRSSPDQPWTRAILIARDDYESQQLNLLLLEAGTWPAGRTVAVERHFPVGPGDSLAIKIGDHELELPVGGTVYNRAGISSSLGGNLIIYTTRERFAELTGRDGFGTLLATIPIYTPTAGALAAGQLQADLADEGFTVIPAAFDQAPFVDPRQAWFEDIIDGVGLVMQIVSIVAMALSLLLIYTTVTAIISQQTSQIGELKAIGASSGQIVAIYLVLVGTYGLLAALISLLASMLSANGLRHVLVIQLRHGSGAVPARTGSRYCSNWRSALWRRC
jgi:putative ABC transport system permease protein